MRSPSTGAAQPGTVYLVGAGPGDPGLITVRGLTLLESADVVVYDRLVDDRLVDRAQDGAELVPVGKRPGGTGVAQEDINAALVEKAGEGKSVVRLKGGDPFIFGRGGEEAIAVAEAGVPFEVVPGVTSAVAAPAYAGIPLTQRGYASAVTIATGSESPDKPDSDVSWDALAQVDGTLVVLMGWQALGSIVESLVSNGRSPDTPIALIQWGTEPYQKTVVSTLASVERDAADAGLAPPVAAVIGQVVDLRAKLRWFDNRPLSGKRVLVTRTRAQAGVLSQLLAQHGADPIEVPTIAIEPLGDYSDLDATLAEIGGYDWTVFASTNAVDAVFARLDALGLDARTLHGTRVAAVGPTTDAALKSRGLTPDYIPERFVTEAIVDGLASYSIAGNSVLLPRSDIGRETLPDGLENLGALVTRVAAYRNVVPEASRERLEQALETGIDVATFTSSSTVKHLVALLDGDVGKLNSTAIACIGPVTAAAAREVGLTVHVEAGEYTIEGLVQAVVDHFSEQGQYR